MTFIQVWIEINANTNVMLYFVAILLLPFNKCLLNTYINYNIEISRKH